MTGTTALSGVDGLDLKVRFGQFSKLCSLRRKLGSEQQVALIRRSNPFQFFVSLMNACGSHVNVSNIQGSSTPLLYRCLLFIITSG